MSEFKVNPTGCPGPIPGTKKWRCDGANCVYGANVDSCRQAIAERGYEVVLTDSLVSEMHEASDNITRTVQQELTEANAIIVDRDKRIQELEAQLKELQDNAEQNESAADIVDISDTDSNIELDGGSGGELADVIKNE